MWKKFIAALKKWFSKKNDKPVVVSPVEDKPADPVADKPTTPSGEPNLAVAKWCGRNYAGLRIDPNATINSASMTDRTLTLSNAVPKTWPVMTVKVDVQSIICLFYEIDGYIMGGKFDWCRPGQTSKGLENVHNGYQGHRMPPKTARCWTMEVSVDEACRTNIVEVVRK